MSATVNPIYQWRRPTSRRIQRGEQETKDLSKHAKRTVGQIVNHEKTWLRSIAQRRDKRSADVVVHLRFHTAASSWSKAIKYS